MNRIYKAKLLILLAALSGLTGIFVTQSSMATDYAYQHTDALPGTARAFVSKQRGNVQGRKFVGDGGFTLKTSNDALITFYGDSFVNPSSGSMSEDDSQNAKAQTPYMMNNNALIITQDGGIKSAVSNANLLAKKSLIHVPSSQQIAGGKNFYWPFSAVVDHSSAGQGKTIYVSLLHMFVPNGGDEWSFKTVSTRIAKYKLNSANNLVFQSLQRTPTPNNAPNDLKWGSSMFIDGDMLYVFGSLKPSGSWGYKHSIARVPTASVGNLSAWRYWNGSVWQANKAQAQTVLSDTDGFESGMAISKNGAGKYTFVYKKHSMIGNKILRATASSIEGPWTVNQTPVATINSSGTEYTYGAYEIPLANDKKGVIISKGNSAPNTPLSEIGIFAAK